MRFYFLLAACLVIMILGMVVSRQALAWDNHAEITRYALQAYESWEPAIYEPIENVLPVLATDSGQTAADLKQFASRINVHGEKINWMWQPLHTASDSPTMLDVLAYSVVEPDAGMDQNLVISEDQKYMGGTSGPTSQAIRHMYFQPLKVEHLFSTFHIPPHEMGFAPQRAALFFDLARQAKQSGHMFWAYRFLGMGLHYVQDIGQPYHATQFGSVRLLPMRKLLRYGWEAFVVETTRIVGNFHLAFEEYTKYLIDSFETTRGELDLLMAFKVPRGDRDLKITFEQNPDLPIAEGVKKLAATSSLIAGEVVAAEADLLGGTLRDPNVDVSKGYKINFDAMQANPDLKDARKEIRAELFEALSNTGNATRWYIDRFKAIPAQAQ